MLSAGGDAFDSEAKGAGGGLSLDDIAGLLSHQGGADRRFQRNLARFEVHLVWADYLEYHTRICREVSEFDFAQEAYPVFGELARVDYAGMLQDFLKEANAADGFRLDTSRFTVSRVFAQVPLGTSFRKVFFHLGVNHVYEIVQLGCNLLVSLL